MKKNKRIGDIICYIFLVIAVVGSLITSNLRVGEISIFLGLLLSLPFYRKYNKARKAVIKQGEEKE